jgi:hypothetical protein
VCRRGEEPRRYETYQSIEAVSLTIGRLCVRTDGKRANGTTPVDRRTALGVNPATRRMQRAMWL